MCILLKLPCSFNKMLVKLTIFYTEVNKEKEKLEASHSQASKCTTNLKSQNFTVLHKNRHEEKKLDIDSQLDFDF